MMGNGITLTRKDGIPDYANRFADSGLAVLAFDYRHWGDSDGEPRRWVSLARQLEDWRAAVDYARGLEGVDRERIAVWGMSLGGGLALMSAAGDQRIAATVALVPMADGLEAWLQPVPASVTLRMIWRAIRGTLTRRPVILPVADPPRSFALLTAPEALPGFERLASANGWRNELNVAGLLFAFARFRPVQNAARIRGPVLVQIGDRDRMAPPRAIEKLSTRAPHAEPARYPIDHFECFWPEHLDHVAGDQTAFLRRHLLTHECAAPPDHPAGL
jgi:dienelactone hydrolase